MTIDSTYNSTLPTIFQHQPPFTKPSYHKLWSWTDTVQGYLNEAHKLTTCIYRNHKLSGEPYTWAIGINIEQEQSPADIKATWNKIVRKLRTSGIIALWVREPSRSNRVHYHLILRSQHPLQVVERIVDAGIPADVPHHKQVSRVRSQYHYPRYMLKCKGYDGHKRLLFQPQSQLGVRLQKYGTIGSFWAKPKEQIWLDIIAQEKNIALALDYPGVRELAGHVHGMMHGLSLQKLERHFALSVNESSTQRWIDALEIEKSEKRVVM